MPKAELYKISVVEGKVLVRVPPQLVGAQTASLDDIQADLHLMDVDYVPEKLLEIYEKTTGDFDYLCDEQTKDFTLQIELTKDESAVFLNIVPPTVEEVPLTEERIYAALKEKDIYQGILDENIKKMISEKNLFRTDHGCLRQDSCKRQRWLCRSPLPSRIRSASGWNSVQSS